MAETTWALLSKGLRRVLQASGLAMGPIHEWERWLTEWADFLDAMKTEIDGRPQIRGWELLRRSTDAEWKGLRLVTRTYRFTLMGYMALNDDDRSELAFQDLADRAMDLLDAQPDLGTTYLELGPCTLRGFANVAFGDVLCHVAEIEVPIKVVKAV